MTEEIFKDIEGYEGLYQVSNFGKVKSFPRHTNNRERILKSADKRGYRTVGLCKNGKSKTFKVHRLVATAFISNTTNDKKHINHIDFNRSNNAVGNLEWVTQAENNKHKVVFGRTPKGENHYASKLKEIDVKLIKFLKDKVVPKDLSCMFPVSEKHIGRLQGGHWWSHVN